MADSMYRQIAEDIRLMIESGEFPPGSRLPTELKLIEDYDASRNTVREAVKSLITRGLVETRPGQGTFVTRRIDPFVTTLSAEPGLRVGGGEGAVFASAVTEKRRIATNSTVRVEIQTATGLVAEGLALPENLPEEERQVVSRHQRRSIDDTLWSLQTSFYPMELVTRGAVDLIKANDVKGGTVTYLHDKLGVKQDGYRDTIAVRQPNENETGLFKLPGDGRVAILEAIRTSYDTEGKPIRLTVTVYPADRTVLAYNNGRVPVEFGGSISSGAADSVTAPEVPAGPGSGQAVERA
jgi:GntR family transcriptional regulator